LVVVWRSLGDMKRNACSRRPQGAATRSGNVAAEIILLGWAERIGWAEREKGAPISWNALSAGTGRKEAPGW
jgi:hypothetical protein